VSIYFIVTLYNGKFHMATCFDSQWVIVRPFEHVDKLKWPDDESLWVKTCRHMKFIIIYIYIVAIDWHILFLILSWFLWKLVSVLCKWSQSQLRILHFHFSNIMNTHQHAYLCLNRGFRFMAVTISSGYAIWFFVVKIKRTSKSCLKFICVLKLYTLR
jgi:hypothetical protein